MKKKIFLVWGKGIGVKKSKKKHKSEIKDPLRNLSPDIWDVKLENECVQKQEPLVALSERSIFNKTF